MIDQLDLARVHYHRQTTARLTDHDVAVRIQMRSSPRPREMIPTTSAQLHGSNSKNSLHFPSIPARLFCLFLFSPRISWWFAFFGRCPCTGGTNSLLQIMWDIIDYSMEVLKKFTATVENSQICMNDFFLAAYWSWMNFSLEYIWVTCKLLLVQHYNWFF